MIRRIPPQTPEIPPRYRLRLPGDSYRIPTSHVSERREYVEPREEFDPRNEPRSSIEWSELRDPQVFVGAVLTVLGGLAVLAYIFTSAKP